MVKIHSQDLDIAKIAESGQCFRLLPDGDGRWTLTALGRVLRIHAAPDGAVFHCSEAEFDAVWRSYFDLDTDYARFRAAVPPSDLFLTEAARFGRGIRILRQDPWEMLVTFLISQRKNIPAIRRSVEALCELCGEPLEGSRAAFPTPERIARLTGCELGGCSLGYRCGYVAAAAQAASARAPDLTALAALDDGALLDALQDFPGVGPKVANCVSLFGYHRLSGFPRDVWISRILDKVYGGVFSPGPYRGFEGVIQQYMFYYARSGGKKLPA